MTGNCSLFKPFSAFALVFSALTATISIAQPSAIVMASTTSTDQSGLFGHLLPAFKQALNIDVKVVAVGTGQAIDMGRRGDADVLFVHDPAAEEKFVADGFSLKRFPVMYNDFVLIGPAADPAKTKGNDIADALKKISLTNAAFVSRGDKSGTHAAELRYWKLAGVNVAANGPANALADAPAMPSYKACGCGMGPALNMAASTGAYVLADRGTWLAFKNRADLAVLVQGDKRLFNQYGALVVNPARNSHTKAVDAQKFVDWLISPLGQSVIASYRIGSEQLFFPNAKP